jgi:CheY-like chemotaxis protein
MDIGMPKMNGYDAARHMRERWRDRFTLVALSGWGQDADKQRSKEAGFNYHLVKPIGLPRLQELIASVEQKLT